MAENESVFIDLSVPNKFKVKDAKYAIKILGTDPLKYHERFEEAKKKYKPSTLKRLVYGLYLCDPSIKFNSFVIEPELTEKYKKVLNDDSKYICLASKFYFDTDVLFLKQEHPNEIMVKKAVILTYATNLRTSELKQLTVKHLNMIMNNELIPIRIKKRITSVRILPIRAILEKYWDLLTEREPIFTCSMKTIITRFRKRCKSIAPKNYKFNTLIGITALRRTNTTYLLQKMDPDQVKEVMRHRNKNTVAEYYNDRKGAVNLLNRIFK